LGISSKGRTLEVSSNIPEKVNIWWLSGLSPVVSKSIEQ
jgi:hypothetical protein